jgi:hypothetical protein
MVHVRPRIGDGWGLLWRFMSSKPLQSLSPSIPGMCIEEGYWPTGDDPGPRVHLLPPRAPWQWRPKRGGGQLSDHHPGRGPGDLQAVQLSQLGGWPSPARPGRAAVARREDRCDLVRTLTADAPPQPQAPSMTLHTPTAPTTPQVFTRSSAVPQTPHVEPLPIPRCFGFGTGVVQPKVTAEPMPTVVVCGPPPAFLEDRCWGGVR